MHKINLRPRFLAPSLTDILNGPVFARSMYRFHHPLESNRSAPRAPDRVAEWKRPMLPIIALLIKNEPSTRHYANFYGTDIYAAFTIFRDGPGSAACSGS
jgi:hypothetical protein